MPPQLATVLCSDACKSIHCKTAERPENPGGLNSNVVVVICPPGKIWGEHPLPLGSDGPVLHCSMMLMLDEFPRKVTTDSWKVLSMHCNCNCRKCSFVDLQLH